MTFHPSQICLCERRAYCSQLGLEDNTAILGVFQTGTFIHEFLEEHFAEQFPAPQFERAVEHEIDGLRFVGQADCYDTRTNAVYDWKTRSSWYSFAFDAERFETIVGKAQRIRNAIARDGIAERVEEIPFERCGCYLCREEMLRMKETGGTSD